MSIAPLSARLFRFLAVVASAAFIVLTLGMRSSPALYSEVSSACSSEYVKCQLTVRRQYAASPSDLYGSCYVNDRDSCWRNKCNPLVGKANNDVVQQCLDQCDSNARNICQSLKR